MTTPIPTSNLPSGFPDEATLNQLASAFFSALPGQAPTGLPVSSAQPSSGLPNLPTGAPGVGASALPGIFHGVQPPANPLPGGATIGPFGNGPQLPGTLVPGGNALPASPQDIGSIALSTPGRAPKAVAGNNVPDNAYTALPALDSRVGGAAVGVPQAYGTSTPPVDASAHGAPLPAAPTLAVLLPERRCRCRLAAFCPERGDRRSGQRRILRTARRRGPARLARRRRSGWRDTGQRTAARLGRVLFQRTRAAAIESRPSAALGPVGNLVGPSAVRRQRDPPRLPDPQRTGQRPAARLVRQRRDDAQAAGRDRPPRLVLRARELEHPPRRA